jgi:hypothetical protein
MLRYFTIKHLKHKIKLQAAACPFETPYLGNHQSDTADQSWPSTPSAIPYFGIVCRYLPQPLDAISYNCCRVVLWQVEANDI